MKIKIDPLKANIEDFFPKKVGGVVGKVVVAAAEANENGLLGIRGILIFEDQQTGDGRKIKADALSWGEGPWPLMAQIENTGHDGAPLVGRIDTLERKGEAINFTGVLDAELGAQAAELIEKQMLKGISADLDSAEVEFQKEDGSTLTEDDSFEEWMNAVMVITEARVRGGTILPMPAFADTELELFTLDASVADAHVASASNLEKLPPSWWFEDPDLEQATPLTITPEGRVFGHIALWETCHVGIKGVCATPPNSNTDYAYFTRGSVRTWCSDCNKEELMATGPITAGLGHASLSVNKDQAVAHYDDTRYGVADVSAGEDSFGIWVSGRVRPTATEEQIENLRASSVSGDWRRISGNLELVAILAVNTPGYPIKRDKALAHVAAGNTQTCLISEPYKVSGAAERFSDLSEEISKLKSVTIDLLRKSIQKK